MNQSNNRLPDHHVSFLHHPSGVPQKTLHLDPATGGLKKGHSATVRMKHFKVGCASYRSLAELRSYLREFRDITGFVQHRNKHCFVDSDDLVSSRRRTEDFEYSCGVTLDVDLPIDNSFAIERPEDVISTLAEVMPELAEAPYLWNCSSGYGIVTADNSPVSTKLGFHIRFMTEEPWTDAHLGVLVDRLFGAGYGYPHAPGDIRTIIDAGTQKPNQLIFEAPPVLCDGLQRPAWANDFHLVDAGKPRPALPLPKALSAKEKREASEKYAALKGFATAASVTRVENAPVYDHQAQAARGEPKAGGQSAGSAVSQNDFDLDLMVYTADGRLVSVSDLSKRTPIHCPFRSDLHPSAFVDRNPQGIYYIHDSAKCITYWQRPKILLEDVEVDRTVALNQQYLGSELTYVNGLTFVKSGVGTGTTTALHQYIQGLRRDFEPGNRPVRGLVLYICHRESLARQVANDLNLCFYKGGDGAGNKGDTLAICVDSVWKLLRQAKLFDHVIIDESEQLIRHLTGNTLAASDNRPSRRRDVITYLRQLIRGANSVVALDAHLSTLSKNFLGSMKRSAPKREIVNHYQRYVNDVVELLDESAVLTNDFNEKVGQGHKVALASDTKDCARETFAKVANDNPDKRGLLITSDGVDLKGASPVANWSSEELMSNLNAVLSDCDYFVYSPSVGTGYSIDDVPFDVVYGHFAYLIPSENIQQLGRIRNAAFRKVFFKDRSPQLTPNKVLYLVEEQWKHNWEVSDVLKQHEVRFNHEGDFSLSVDPSDDPYLRLYATVRYHEHCERLGGRERFVQLLNEQGFHIDTIDSSAEAIDNSRASNKKAKALYEQAHRDGVLNAEPITESRARQIRLRTYKPMGDTYT